MVKGREEEKRIEKIIEKNKNEERRETERKGIKMRKQRNVKEWNEKEGIEDV